MSNKLVYIDSVRDCLNKAYGEGNLLGLNKVLDSVPAVELMPKIISVDLCKDADIVNVVRCKNCKNYHEDKYGDGRCCDDGGIDDYVNPDDFCCYGERRDKNADD